MSCIIPRSPFPSLLPLLALIAAQAAPLPFRIAVPDGFAAGATGGGNAEPVTVTTAAAFKAAAAAAAPAVIVVSGKLEVGAVRIGSHKTIVGATTEAQLSGTLKVDGTNCIFQNLIVGPSPADAMELSGATRIFIHKCEFFDGADGSLDIVRGSDSVTVSWSRFYYVDQSDHKFAMLIGNSDDATGDRGKLRVTLHHNWFGAGVSERMPRVRYGQVHIYNNYYGAPGGDYNIGVGFESQILAEGSYFENQAAAWRYQGEAGGGKIQWRDLCMVGTATPASIPNSDVFDPPYAYSKDAACDVKARVMGAAGNTAAPIAIGIARPTLPRRGAREGVRAYSAAGRSLRPRASASAATVIASTPAFLRDETRVGVPAR